HRSAGRPPGGRRRDAERRRREERVRYRELGALDDRPGGRPDGGDNLLKAATRQANPSASGKLKLHNYPITGPIFSGPHETPFVCMTQNFRLPASTETLGPPLDANCSAATRVSYVYRSTGPSPTFKAMPSLTAYPADLARP